MWERTGKPALIGYRNLQAAPMWVETWKSEMGDGGSCTQGGLGWDWAHLAPQPLFGLLYQPRIVDDDGDDGDDGDDECWAVGAISGRGIPSIRIKPVSCPLSTTNCTRFDPGSKPGRRGQKPATDCRSHGTVSHKGVLWMKTGKQGDLEIRKWGIFYARHIRNRTKTWRKDFWIQVGLRRRGQLQINK
jgi:hypothetical protein